jgi:hypothetical protein
MIDQLYGPDDNIVKQPLPGMGNVNYMQDKSIITNNEVTSFWNTLDKSYDNNNNCYFQYYYRLLLIRYYSKYVSNLLPIDWCSSIQYWSESDRLDFSVATQKAWKWIVENNLSTFH